MRNGSQNGFSDFEEGKKVLKGLTEKAVRNRYDHSFRGDLLQAYRQLGI